ncbi:MAG: hypothetical protein U0990_12605 [Candidatus Nanopelagicales bacterium]|nr:hypothetical protein [Candidatus Nanopelagicales bacterium]
MPDPTPTLTAREKERERLRESTATATPTATPRPLEAQSTATLRAMWRAGPQYLTEADYEAELRARGYTAEEIAKEKTVGVSTAKSTAGQLTGSEAAGVNAIRNLPPATATPVGTATPFPTATPAAATASVGGSGAQGDAGAAPVGGFGGQVADATAQGQATAGGEQVTGAQRQPVPNALPRFTQPGAPGSPGGGGGGGSSEPAKPKPVRFVTAADGRKIWVQDSGKKDANGKIIYNEVERPPVPEGFIPNNKAGNQGQMWDPMARGYRVVEWDTEDQSWLPTDKVNQLPGIQRTPIGEALSTGRDVAAGNDQAIEGTVLPMHGTQTPGPVEGLPSVQLGTGQTPIFPTNPANTANLDPNLTGYGYSPEVSTQGVPVSDETGEVGVVFAGQTGGGTGQHSISQFMGPQGGIGQYNSAILEAYGQDVPDNPIEASIAAVKLQNEIARMRAEGLQQQEIQRHFTQGNIKPTDEYGNQVSTIYDTFRPNRSGNPSDPGTRVSKNISLATARANTPNVGGVKPLDVFGDEVIELPLGGDFFVGNRKQRFEAGPFEMVSASGANSTGNEAEIFDTLPIEGSIFTDPFTGQTIDLAATPKSGSNSMGDNPFVGGGATPGQREARAERDQIKAANTALAGAAADRAAANEGYKYNAAGLMGPVTVSLPAGLEGKVSVPPGVRVKWEQPKVVSQAEQTAQMAWQSLLMGHQLPSLQAGIPQPYNTRVGAR